MDFKDWLRNKLIDKNLNQDDFAHLLGVTGQAVNHWVIGRKLPSTSMFRKIAEVLGIPKEEMAIFTKQVKEIETTFEIKIKPNFFLGDQLSDKNAPPDKKKCLGSGGRENLDTKLERIAKEFDTLFLDHLGELDEDSAVRKNTAKIIISRIETNREKELKVYINTLQAYGLGGAGSPNTFVFNRKYSKYAFAN